MLEIFHSTNSPYSMKLNFEHCIFLSVCVPHIHSGCGLARCVWLLRCASLPLLQHVVYLCHHEVPHGQPHQH